MSGFAIQPAPLESNRFNIKAGKLLIDDVVDVARINPLMDQLDLEFLTTRVKVGNLPLVQSLGKTGFILTDTLVHYLCKLDVACSSIQNPLNIHHAVEKNYPGIVDIAQKSFVNFKGHYHADPGLDPQLCDDAYTDWSRRICSDKSLTDVLLVSTEGDTVTSFLGLKKTGKVAQGVLGGVHPEHQGKGLYRQLIRLSKKWAFEADCTDLVYPTQITHQVSQKVWAQEGIIFHEAFYTLHYWKSAGGVAK